MSPFIFRKEQSSLSRNWCCCSIHLHSGNAVDVGVFYRSAGEPTVVHKWKAHLLLEYHFFRSSRQSGFLIVGLRLIHSGVLVSYKDDIVGLEQPVNTAGCLITLRPLSNAVIIIGLFYDYMTITGVFLLLCVCNSDLQASLRGHCWKGSSFC